MLQAQCAVTAMPSSATSAVLLLVVLVAGSASGLTTVELNRMFSADSVEHMVPWSSLLFMYIRVFMSKDRVMP
jgi:hypothetical protein